MDRQCSGREHVRRLKTTLGADLEVNGQDVRSAFTSRAGAAVLYESLKSAEQDVKDLLAGLTENYHAAACAEAGAFLPKIEELLADAVAVAREASGRASMNEWQQAEAVERVLAGVDAARMLAGWMPLP